MRMLDALELDDIRHMIDLLTEQHLTVAVAEGDTGGVLLELLTAVPGSSRVVRGGVVAYHDDLKRAVLGVAPKLIEQHGAGRNHGAPLAGRPRSEPPRECARRRPRRPGVVERPAPAWRT